jgi:glycosyltransferase involved in cell wall biosynthesis
LLFPRNSFWWQDEPKFTPIRWAKALLRRCHTAEPLLLHSYYSSTARQLAAEAASVPFDLVWVERLLCLRWLPEGIRSRVIVDLDDLEHRKLRREIAVTKTSSQTAFDYLEYLKIRRFELGLPKLPHEFIVSSKLDRKILGNAANVQVVPNGVVLPHETHVAGDDGVPPTILFVGLMNYQPNEDAACFFAREVLPSIHIECPSARFMIVGRSPSAAVRELHDGNKIVVTGTVSDVEPYLRKACVVVAPLRVGGGTRIKILEAMAHGRPVVATSIGAEGLEVEPGKHLLIADTATELADACVRLLRDRETGRGLAASAVELVRAKYDWSRIEQSVAGMIRGKESLEDSAATAATAGGVEPVALINTLDPAGRSALS